MPRRDWLEPPLDREGNQRDGKVTWYRAMNQQTDYARNQERVGWGTRREAQRARDVRWRWWDTQRRWDSEERTRGKGGRP
jgi:hypothetical protein